MLEQKAKEFGVSMDSPLITKIAERAESMMQASKQVEVRMPTPLDTV
eukprot:SAG11_NODE_32126_length_286_cov_0.818182_2_plen_46_part_01